MTHFLDNDIHWKGSTQEITVMAQPAEIWYDNDTHKSTLEELCAKYDIRVEMRMGGAYNEDFKDSIPWTAILRHKRKQMSLTIYLPKEQRHEPTSAEILRNILKDILSVEGIPFEQWCAISGYDIDSRKAERMYIFHRKLMPKVKKFLEHDYLIFMNAL